MAKYGKKSQEKVKKAMHEMKHPTIMMMYCEKTEICYSDFAMTKYIVSDPAILGGMPVIKGTRVPVARILSLFREGYTLKEIHEQFDHITTATLEGTLEEVVDMVTYMPHGTQIL